MHGWCDWSPFIPCAFQAAFQVVVEWSHPLGIYVSTQVHIRIIISEIKWEAWTQKEILLHCIWAVFIMHCIFPYTSHVYPLKPRILRNKSEQIQVKLATRSPGPCSFVVWRSRPLLIKGSERVGYARLASSFAGGSSSAQLAGGRSCIPKRT